MKITYIHHSSFLVETEKHIMLFDYAGGKLPALADKPLMVFVSHAHSDHFSKDIFNLSHSQAAYIISKDIRKSAVPRHLLEKTIFAGPDESFSVMGANISTLKSTDEGVAFLIEADGKRIYHAGDLNNWRWEGEPEEWNQSMEKAYIDEIRKIERCCPSVAFLLLDPRQADGWHLCIDQFMDIVGAEHVFPMHFWGDYSICRRLKHLPQAAGYAQKIAEITHEGQEFEI